jgi:two-component system, chemotaxis family, CheB/CheR fusion protein
MVRRKAIGKRRRRGTPVARAEPGRCPVVGMGASAGGLATFETFFRAVAPDSGAAFVLIQHLDPTRKSLTAELVAKHTRMPVVQVERETPVERDHVYVIPPNKYLTIAHGRLRLAAPDVPRGMRMPIDQFFRSLASDQHERAVGIVLSGTGTDGALGLKEIEAAGGMTMAQTPETAQYDGMPRSAIATGGVDHLLPVERMPAMLVRYLRHACVNRPSATAPGRGDEAHDLGTILDILATRSKMDFSCYEPGTLRRRIQRRMSLRHVTRMSDYAAVLRRDADEARALGQDLLISVTTFFRDPPAWQALDDRVVTPLVERKPPGQPLRVWVPGCATGEEAYSIAMLFAERLQAARKGCPLQLFASDAGDSALEVGRAGVYPESIAVDVSPERLRRFFVKEEHTYRVARDLRESVTFAHQNLLTDPPFSRQDLLCCRNLLMYLESGAQEKVLMLLHFSLLEGGYLFLGSAETIGERADLFEPISNKWRIYRRIGPTRQDKIELPVVGDVGPHLAPARIATGRPTLARIAALTQQLLLGRYAPACVVINRRGEILHFSGPTERYLVQPPGPPTRDLFAQARDGLQAQLRAAVQRAIREDRPVGMISRAVRHGGVLRRVKLSVEPLRVSSDAEGLLLVSFEDETPPPRPEPPAAAELPGAEESVIRQLESELKTTREELRTTIEQLETSNEELKASNEEIMSANEELSTINVQLQAEVDELERTNNDLDNLLASTNVATIFLDPSFRIRRFTPLATRLFNLIPSDVGRPLADIVQQFTDPDLLKDARLVLAELAPVRKEVQTQDGRCYMRETLPYRTRDDRIEGVVITFSDAAAQVLREARRRAEAVVETVHEGLLVLDASLRVVSANRAFCETFGTSPAELEGRSLFAIGGGDWDIPELRAALSTIQGEGEPIRDLEIRRAFARGGERRMLVWARPLQTAGGRPHLILLAIEDVTKPRRQEETLRESEAKIRAILDAAVDCIVTTDAHGIVSSWNAAAERTFGYAARDVVGQNVRILMPPPYRDEHDTYLARYLETGVARIIGTSGREVVGRRKDGTTFPLDLAVSEFHDGKGSGFVGILRDLTKRKQAEEEERRHQAELARVLRVSLVGELGVGLAHEVGQPLAAVANTLEACATKIRAGKAAPKALLGLVEQAIEQSIRAAEIVRNARDLVRGRLPRREAVDLRRVIESAARLIAGQVRQHHIGVRLALGDEPLSVHVGRVEIEQVVLNLLQNAVDAISQVEKKGRHHRIVVSASPTTEKKMVEVAVRDTGAGIPESLMGRLFEPFFTTKPTGIGMGLAICRSIVEAHGGRMWVAAGEHRRGATTIRFTIPLVPEELRPDRRQPRRRR